MFITIINDCKSPDDIARQESRINALIPSSSVSFFGVSSDFSVNATLEAAGGLIDILDAVEGQPGYVLVNVAPRGDIKKDGNNGTPFCYFKYKQTTVISTLRGMTLSLVKKLKLIDTVNQLDVNQVMDYVVSRSLLDPNVAEYTKTTQFRSYDFVPRVAAWLHQNIDLPFSSYNIANIDDVSNCIWYVDDFGNCKTTLLKKDIPQPLGTTLKTNLGEFKYYQRLKDVPKGETGIYLGSSGINQDRFIEIATQQQSGSAATSLKVGVGQEIHLI